MAMLDGFFRGIFLEYDTIHREREFEMGMTQHEKNYQPNIMWITALVFFATGSFGGFFLTSLPELNEGNWRYWACGRIFWQLGGAVWFGWAICDPLGEPGWKGGLAGGILGTALCIMPFLDVAIGPERMEGQLTSVKRWTGEIWRAKGGASTTIHCTVEIKNREGVHQLKLKGRQVNLWGNTFTDCQKENGTINAMMLRHLNVVLGAECTSNRRQGKMLFDL